MTYKEKQKLRDLIASIIIEQASCERSGEAWGRQKLEALDSIFPEHPPMISRGTL
jgi:hypothetical protein